MRNQIEVISTAQDIPKSEMGYNGFCSFVAETTYGNNKTVTKRLAYVRPTEPAVRNNIIQDRFLTNEGRDLGVSLHGNFDCGLRLEMLASEFALLKHVLGTVSSSVTAPAYTHTLTPADTIKSLSFEGGLDSTSDYVWKLSGCKIGRYSLIGADGAPWVERFEIIGSHAKSAATVTSLSAATVRPMWWFDTVVQWSYAGSTYTTIENVSALEMHYENQLIPKRYLATVSNIPKRCLNAIHEGGRAYAIRLVKDFTNLNEFKQFFGGTALSAPTVAPFVGKLKVTIQRTATDNFEAEFTSLLIDNPGWKQPVGGESVTYDMVLVGKTLGSIVVKNATATYW